MNTKTQKEIVSLEEKYWDAMKNNDIEAAVSLTKFPCTVVSPKGAQRISEQEYRKMMSSNKGDSYKEIEIKNPQVDILNKDTALISYSIQHNGMNMLDVSTWVNENGKWLCAFHAENPLQITK